MVCTALAIAGFANDARANLPRSSDHDVFEGVYYRPSGSRITFVWQTLSHTERGEWRLYRGEDLDSFEFVDLTPARLGTTTYRYEAERPLLEREYFQLRYRGNDGTETVLATVLLVGTEMSTGLQPLPDGPPPLMFMISTGWQAPGIAFDVSSLSDRIPLGNRPEPAVPPPRVFC